MKNATSDKIGTKAFFFDNLVYRFFSPKIGLEVKKRNNFFFFLIYKITESQARKKKKRTSHQE